MSAHDFRTRQALADLERAAGGDPLSDDTGVAFDGAASPEHLWAATACLLWQALVGVSVDPSLADIWGQRRDALRTAPSAIRSALMQGFRLYRQTRGAKSLEPPYPADLVTYTPQEVAAALIPIGQRMTAEERGHVARADYGCEEARQRAALETLLADPQLAYPEGDIWYPAEVVELVSHVPGQPGHVPCLAIVLLDALRTGDERGNADYRLANQYDAISAFDPKVRDPFFAAFRHLYESSPHWSSSVPEPFTMPWVELI
jgi:hypothetical protein